MRILIATRSIAHSDTAVRMGNIIYQIVGGTINLLTVINSEDNRARAETSLLQAQNIINIPESQIQATIRVGHSVEEIAAEAAGYDLVIIGEPARNRFLNRRRAPIAEELVAHLTCPILITRGQPRPIRKLLFCESGHEPSLADDLTAKMPSLITQADQVAVLHVMSQIAAGPGVAGWALRADAETLMEENTPEGQLLEGEVTQLEQLDVQPEAIVRHGLVVRELLKEARNGNYDLVIIGAHPGTGWEHLLLGDLAREIIGQIDRPLLVIKR